MEIAARIRNLAPAILLAAPLPAQERPAPPAPAAVRTRIALMGDVMLGRLVSEAVPRRKPASFWGTTLPILERADLRILNLETTITTVDTRWTEWPKTFHYRAVPEAVDVLKAAGIDHVNLANNHILDFREAGLRETLRHLDRAGIRHTGAGDTAEEASATVTLRAGDLSIGVFSLADHYPDWDARSRGAGIYFVSIPPREEEWRRLKDLIGKLREANDLVLLSVHWGPNMRDAPSDKVVRFAHRLIDEGVDVIHGHSAHVFHGVEIRKGRVIFCDTGNFLDDYAVDPVLRNDLSLLFLLELEGKRIDRLELVPVVIHDLRVDAASGAERDEILRLFQERTRRFGTPCRIEEGRIVISAG